MRAEKLTGSVKRMMIKLDGCREGEGRRDGELQSRPEQVHQRANHRHHPPPPSFGIIVPGQKSSGLHLRAAVVRMAGLLLFHGLLLLLPLLLAPQTILLFALLLRARVQKRPGSRSRYRHHTHAPPHPRADYVPVSCTLVPLARPTLAPCIRDSTGHRLPALVTTMLSILSKAAYNLVARLFLVATRAPDDSSSFRIATPPPVTPHLDLSVRGFPTLFNLSSRLFLRRDCPETGLLRRSSFLAGFWIWNFEGWSTSRRGAADEFSSGEMMERMVFLSFFFFSCSDKKNMKKFVERGWFEFDEISY